MSEIGTATYLHFAMNAGNPQAAIYGLISPGVVVAFLVEILIAIGILIIFDIL